MTDKFYKWLCSLIASGDVHPFYCSSQWVRLSHKVLDMDKHECQLRTLRGGCADSRASGGESTGCSSTPPVYVVRETECILGVLLILISCRSQGRLLFCRKAKRMAESIERETADKEDSQDGSRRIV